LKIKNSKLDKVKVNFLMKFRIWFKSVCYIIRLSLEQG